MDNKKKYNYCILYIYMDCYGKYRIQRYRICRTNYKEYFDKHLKWGYDCWFRTYDDYTFHTLSYYDMDNDIIHNPPISRDEDGWCGGDRIKEIEDFKEFKEKLQKKNK